MRPFWQGLHATAILARAGELLKSLEESGRGSGQVVTVRAGIEEVTGRWGLAGEKLVGGEAEGGG